MSRYQRAVEIEDLVLALAQSRRGLTVDDVAERYGVSRRTAERMRDAVAERFPLAEVEATPGDRRKRWRLVHRDVRALVRLGPEDARLIEEAAAALKADGRPELAQGLRHIATQLRLL